MAFNLTGPLSNVLQAITAINTSETNRRLEESSQENEIYSLQNQINANDVAQVDRFRRIEEISNLSEEEFNKLAKENPSYYTGTPEENEIAIERRKNLIEKGTAEGDPNKYMNLFNPKTGTKQETIDTLNRHQMAMKEAQNQLKQRLQSMVSQSQNKEKYKHLITGDK